MKFQISRFLGMAPRADSRALAAGMASEARNCKLWNSQLRPWRGFGYETYLAKSAPIQTIHRAFVGAVVPGEGDAEPTELPDGVWLHWPELVDVARGHIAQDPLDRHFFTGTDRPRYTDAQLAVADGTEAWPNRSRPLGVEAPPAAPTVALALAASTPLLKKHTYTFTFVEEYPKGSGNWYEGNPSTRVLSVERMSIENVTLSNLPVYAGKKRNVAFKRVYRATELTAQVDNIEIDADNGVARVYFNAFHNLKLGATFSIGGSDQSVFNGTFAVTGVDADEPAMIEIALPAGAEVLEEVTGEMTAALTYPPVFIAQLANGVTRWVDDIREDEPFPIYVAEQGIGDFPLVSTLALHNDGTIWSFRLAARELDIPAGRWVRFSGSTTQPGNWNRAFKVGGITEQSETWLSGTLPDAPATAGTLYIKMEYAGYNLYTNRRTTTKVPRPNAKFTLAENYEAVGEADERARRYVVIFVSNRGNVREESAPGPVSELITVQVGDVVTVGNLPQPVGDYGDEHDVTHLAIYRTVTSGAGTDFYFVAEVPTGQSSYTDALPDEDLGEPLASIGYYPPPADMHSLLAYSNGMMLGASGKTVCVSKPYRPHAWDPLNQISLRSPIVGMGMFDTTAVVLTEKNPHLISGASPEYLSERELPVEQGCVSKRSIVSASDGVYYATPDGLMRINANGPQLISAPYFTRDEWRELINPGTLHGCVFEGAYFGFCESSDGVRRGFVLNPHAEGAGFTWLDFYATAVFVDPLADRMYMVLDNGYTEVSVFDQESPQPYLWRSATMVTPRPIALTCARVLADDYARLFIEVHGREPGQPWRRVASLPVLSAEPLRLQVIGRFREWRLTLAGSSAVSMAETAETIGELA